MDMSVSTQNDTLRILILDDDEFIGQSIAFMAQTASPHVELTTAPEQFFRMVRDWGPSHIILDLMMPEMDGVQVLSKLGEQGCTAKLVITSGVDSRILEAARLSAREHGLDIAGILAKPFKASALRELLHPPQEERTDHQLSSRKNAPPLKLDRAKLKRALHNRELYVVYQPKVDCLSGRLAGVEALLRWEHGRHGLIPPDRFIRKAEGWGMIDELTVYVLDLALPWFAEWCQRHPECLQSTSDQEPISLSINLSARTLHNSHFLDNVVDRCKALALDPAQLIFELTETATMDDPVTALDLLTRLRMQGIRLSIDDFGTGYSSMLQLVRLPFSEIKVDKSFVMTAAHSLESRMVIRSIVELGHSLGMTVTAEGVEDENTLQYLQELRCDLAQGYFISRPVARAALETWVANSAGQLLSPSASR